MNLKKWDTSEHLKSNSDQVRYFKNAVESDDLNQIKISLENIAKAMGFAVLAKKFNIPVEDLYDFVNNDNSTFDSSVLNIDAIK